jgi:hypothetical protein
MYIYIYTHICKHTYLHAVCGEENGSVLLGQFDARPECASRRGIETARGLVKVAAQGGTDHLCDVCMYVCMHVCIWGSSRWQHRGEIIICEVYLCVCVCMYACMYMEARQDGNTGGNQSSDLCDVCMYVCMYVYEGSLR